nr:hypothetical protein [uncultured Paracoccus sp.]
MRRSSVWLGPPFRAGFDVKAWGGWRGSIPPEPLRRYQRERPGELTHLDIKKLGRFARSGRHVTGTRFGCRSRSAG